MKALTYHGAHKVQVDNVPDPTIQAPDDVILRITATAICGSDLHLYRGKVPGLTSGDILGHEFMGTVENVGPGVTALQTGEVFRLPRLLLSCPTPFDRRMNPQSCSAGVSNCFIYWPRPEIEHTMMCSYLLLVANPLP
jgi:threonine dehydrogenase-like Zn-dependent dehydrogenase